MAEYKLEDMTLKEMTAVGLVSLTLTFGVLFAQDVFRTKDYFESTVYESAITSEEIKEQEKIFYEETDLMVADMSFWDKYVYGKSLQKGYISK